MMANVLVVDDDADVAALVQAVLMSEGHAVTVAGDGARALAEAAALRPDVVVLDWMMPGMTGLDVCRALRADEAYDATRILMLTARSAPSDIETARAPGADDYIVKPFAPRELRRRVSSLIA